MTQEQDFLRQVAAQKVALFERQFGENYRLLTYHAALPLVLTPELVHYLRTEFLLDTVPWDAEADLLLSDLCSQVGYELYVMDTAVRSYLLAEMKQDPQIPADRMQAVARVLISYVTYLSQINPGQRQREIQAQRWAAMGYLGAESCQQMAQEIAEQFFVGGGQGNNTAMKAEFARLAKITQELEGQLQQEPELLAFAEQVSRSLRSPQSLTVAEQRRVFQVGGVRLQLPDSMVSVSELEGLPELQSFEFDVMTFVEMSEGSTYDVFSETIVHEFEVATIEIAQAPPDSIFCTGTAQLLATVEDEEGEEEQIIITVENEDLEWESDVEEQRPMGPEICHTAIYSGEIVSASWSVYEYPPGEINHVELPEIIEGDFEVIQNFDREDFVVGSNLEDFVFPNKIHRVSKRDWQYEERIAGKVILELVKIPAGTFFMGSPEDELDRYDDESPQHLVEIPEFYMGKYPVTQAQWKFVANLPQVNRSLNADPAHFKGDDRPVENVSWHDAVEFCARLSRRTSREYRLPTEAEWEYACRALPLSAAGVLRAGDRLNDGTTSFPFHFWETIDASLANYRAQDAEDMGWSGKYGRGQLGEYREQTTPVGSFKVANDFGLYDMHGNVWEWCMDHWHENYEGAPTDGSAWIDLDASEDAFRVLRGGSWSYDPGNCRSASRYRFRADYRRNSFGFRVISPARTLP
jgi:formylglycine-generating enzyme required for sulfatase activity